jgi:Zn finger protein HypA/HybF involved in hydrogenase expression
MPLLECVNCSERTDSEALDIICKRCASAMILVAPELKPLRRHELEELPLGVWRYRAFLPELRA